MSVDSLTFIGESLFGPRASAEDLLRHLDEAEVERAIVCALKPPGYFFGPANDQVAEAVRAHPTRLTGFARVDPNLGDEAGKELERAFTDLGLRGLFLHPWEETFRVSGPLVPPLIEIARAHDAPVIVASGYPWVAEGLQVGDLASRFPDVTFVATNGLQINISGLGGIDADLALVHNSNLHMQTTGVYREDFIEGVAARLGAERVLFASAFPFFDTRLEVLRVRWAHVDDAVKDLMLRGNAERLLLGSN